MLTQKQVKEIKEHLEQAQNPLFFFDNDPDGLCSFLLLQRWLGRGKGVPIKSFPDLSKDYFRKVSELGADYVFILDKPVISTEFFEEVEKFNVPVVWIDHHEVQVEIPEFIHYYNPLLYSSIMFCNLIKVSLLGFFHSSSHPVIILSMINLFNVSSFITTYLLIFLKLFV